MKKLLSFIVIFFPWRLKRFLLVHIWKYEIHPTAWIGISYIFPQKLSMGEGARIYHLNVAIHLDYIKMGKNSSFGKNNWITGYPSKKTRFFSHDKERKCELIIGRESAITQKHHIDCTNAIHIGDFVIVAGYGSQLLTHSIDVYKNRQDSHPITIGDYCFVSTRVIILGGAYLPSHCVLAAGAVLVNKYQKDYTIYGGIPAQPIKEVPKDSLYFNREKGFVY